MFGFPRRPIPKRVMERIPYVAGREIYFLQQMGDRTYGVEVHQRVGDTITRILTPSVLESDYLAPTSMFSVTAHEMPEDTTALFDGSETSAVSVSTISTTFRYHWYRFDFHQPIVLSYLEAVTTSSGAGVRISFVGSPTQIPLYTYNEILSIPNTVTTHRIYAPLSQQHIQSVWFYTWRSSTQRNMTVRQIRMYLARPSFGFRGVRLTDAADEYIVEYTPLGS